MAFGKNSRPQKRSSSSSSSSSFLSTATTVGFLALCLIGVWMLTSSSVITSQTITTRFAKPIRTDPPPFQEDLSSDDDPRKISSALGRKSGENHQISDAESNVDDDDNGIADKGQGDRAERKEVEEEEESGEIRQPKEMNYENQEQSQEKEENEEVQLKEKEGNEDNQKIAAESDEHQLQEEESVRNEERDESGEKSQQVEGESEENQQQNEGESDVGQNQEQSQQQNEVDSNDQNQEQSNESENDENKKQIQQQNESENEENKQQFQQLGESENGQESRQNVQEESNVENEAHSQQNEETSSVVEAHEIDESVAKETVQQSSERLTEQNASESFPDEARSSSEISKKSEGQKKSWSTQADQSQNEKERRQESSMYGYTWEMCNVTAGPDYIPCLDNEKALKHVPTRHYQHRERHCPEEGPSCLVPLPKGYRRSIEWPKSRDKIWYNNIPHTKLADVKGHQNWVKVTKEYLIFPGGGTQFMHGAIHYIDFIQQAVPKIAWGKHTRVILDVGCGVASFGGYLFERDVLAMSFAPKDEHEAQVQFALERGIPAISAVMGSQRLPFPSRVFDIVHCARCRVPWHAEGGTLLLELNRVLRPGGYFVWSATPVYQKLKEDMEIWKEMKSLTASMCWDLVTIQKDKLNSVGAAIYRKPVSNECYKNRRHNNPPVCKENDDPNAAWYVPLQTCMHRVPVASAERGSQWPKDWPRRLQAPPYWLNNTQVGVYGKPALVDFVADYEHWKRVVSKSYLSGLGISWSNVRNVMDMRAVYGGFAAALNDLKLWVMNVVNVDSPDTLPIIYERGLFGIYHDWCESFSTYPRTYDLLHADHLFSSLKKRCKIVPVMAEIDRIVRPGGKIIVRDESSIVGEVENLLKSLHWEVRLTFSKDQVGILSAQKSDWRPETFSAYS